MRGRRTLAGLAAAAAFMTSDGCAFLKGEGCEKRTTDKLYALFIGFACLGARHEPPTAQFSLRPNPVVPGDKVDLDGTRSFAANGDDVVALRLGAGRVRRGCGGGRVRRRRRGLRVRHHAAPRRRHAEPHHRPACDRCGRPDRPELPRAALHGPERRVRRPAGPGDRRPAGKVRGGGGAGELQLGLRGQRRVHRPVARAVHHPHVPDAGRADRASSGRRRGRAGAPR